MLKKDNLLLMDEPTNHLDMDSREVLEDALFDFPGTILAISHDRYFINRFADRVMVMNEDGNDRVYRRFRRLSGKARPAPCRRGNRRRRAYATSLVRERRRDRQQSARLRELQAAVRRAEEAIADSEKRVAVLEAQLSDPQTYADPALMLSLTQSYREQQALQETLYDALEEAEAAVGRRRGRKLTHAGLNGSRYPRFTAGRAPICAPGKTAADAGCGTRARPFQSALPSA